MATITQPWTVSNTRQDPIILKKSRSKMIGRRFNKLVVLECIQPYANKSKISRYKCACDCGNEVLIWSYDLYKRKSCGCVRKENGIKLAKLARKPERLTLTTQFNAHRGSCKTRGFTPLSIEEWKNIVFKACFYCGKMDTRTAMSNYSYKNKRKGVYTAEELKSYEMQLNGIDRVDSNKGYEPENCVPCCSQCNFMKIQYPVEQFLSKVKDIYLHKIVNYQDMSLDKFLIN